jgi:DNA alkylation repair enzyme
VFRDLWDEKGHLILYKIQRFLTIESFLKKVPRMYRTAFSCSALVGDIKAGLARLANPEIAKAKSAYFKDVCAFYGIKTPDIEALHKSLQASVEAISTEELLSVSNALLAENYHESKQFGAFILFKGKTRLLSTASNELFSSVQASFDDGHVFDWATADTLSTRVLGQLLLKDPKTWSPKLQDWSKQADKPWKMRAAAVSFIPACKHIGKAASSASSSSPSWPHSSYCRESLLQIALNVLQRAPNERFPQLGVGWSLRELGASTSANHTAMIAFLRENIALFTREGLSYALEKSPGALQAELTALHKEKKASTTSSSSSSSSSSSAAATSTTASSATVGSKRKRALVDLGSKS